MPRRCGGHPALACSGDSADANRIEGVTALATTTGRRELELAYRSDEPIQAVTATLAPRLLPSDLDDMPKYAALQGQIT